MKFVIEHLSKRFEKKEVLRDIDFAFEEGKIYGLLGRNGAGKTTLFNCLNRDIPADGGSLGGGGRETPRSRAGGHWLCAFHADRAQFFDGPRVLKFFLDIHEKTIENRSRSTRISTTCASRPRTGTSF